MSVEKDKWAFNRNEYDNKWQQKIFIKEAFNVITKFNLHNK